MEQQKRPLLLSAAIFLSLAGSGAAALIYLLAAIFFDDAKEVTEKFTNIQTPQKLDPFYFVIYSTLYVLSLAGILKMRKMQRSGYFVYTGAQLTLLVVPLLWMGSHAFSMTNTAFTFLFITIYSLFLKKFRNYKAQSIVH